MANPYGSVLKDGMTWFIRNVSNFFADRIIETGPQLQERLGRFIGKSVVIANCPIDPGEELSRKFPTGDAIRICIGGSLNRERDQLDVILRAVEMHPSGSVSIVASGWLYDDYAKQAFASHSAVTYDWVESPQDFLVRAASCDAILYLRGDAGESEYRSWVLPNRFFDAMAVGRPIIVGSSAKLSQWVHNEGLGYICPIGDEEALAKIFQEIKDGRKHLPQFARHARDLFVDGWTWEIMEIRLKELYDDLKG